MPTRISDATREKCASAWQDALARVAAGETTARVLKPYGLTTQCMWAYRAQDKELRDQWHRAIMESADALADEALDAVRNPDIDPKRARVMAGALQWAAEKRNPDRYAPRTHGTLDVRTLDLRPIMAAAEARLAASRRGLVVEAEVLPLSNVVLEPLRDVVTVGDNTLY